jgi:hypothetical protein
MVICGAYDVAVKMMSDSGFLSALLNFPKEQINDETVELLQPYFAAPDFNYESARKASGNVAGGCCFRCWRLAAAAACHQLALSSLAGVLVDDNSTPCLMPVRLQAALPCAPAGASPSFLEHAWGLITTCLVCCRPV